MSLSSSEMDISNAPSAVESPVNPIHNPSSSSPVSAHAGPHIHDAEAYLEEGRCSTSSPETQGDKHANGGAGLDQQAMVRSPVHHDQGLSESPHGIVDVNYSDQPGGEPSAFDSDVEKGWGSSNAKKMDVDEEVPGECCRVCHLTVDKSPSAGHVIKLGCACKDDLALAHQRCAETWFTIKGNRTCEICGSTAQNILGNRNGVLWNDMEASHQGSSRAERCWQNQPLCNTLVVCVLLVLIASWLFRVTLF
ncbi:hypothetical protein GOP47_0022804 [Adiantum capillus-veneris]|uniref:RING-CH-type domain-containing protein n=1 Tax=Adiantum capillus-veneris TaxID=13818 RepID=A0A9D4U6Z3_ADICA|nr:hypothetical protein GOP47_0022804 [Adiantum capillus-veneris]